MLELARLGAAVEAKAKTALAIMQDGVTQKELAIFGANVLMDFDSKRSQLKRVKMQIERE